MVQLGKGLKTSHVIINQYTDLVNQQEEQSLKTSHVIINPIEADDYLKELKQFKNISCYY